MAMVHTQHRLTTDDLQWRMQPWCHWARSRGSADVCMPATYAACLCLHQQSAMLMLETSSMWVYNSRCILAAASRNDPGLHFCRRRLHAHAQHTSGRPTVNPLTPFLTLSTSASATLSCTSTTCTAQPQTIAAQHLGVQISAALTLHTLLLQAGSIPRFLNRTNLFALREASSGIYVQASRKIWM